ncbi:hypothetical protein DL95DRAFT_472613 [Leptodontidium sp. 2 PMI_412]|nr:hypothetical protein DL95DRAFT_472613 [Leptodontidium sp. 2 PMI_412]
MASWEAYEVQWILRTPRALRVELDVALPDTDALVMRMVNWVYPAAKAFRTSFNSICEDRTISCTPDALGQLAQEDIQNLTLDLLFALRNLPVIRLLRSKTSHGTLRSDLLKLISAVSSDNFHFDRIKPLLTAALTDNRDDALIWDQVYTVTESLTSPKQLTPPTAFEKAVFDTPLRSSSASQRGIEQTHDEVDQRILEELTGRVYYDVGGFFERYFEGKSTRGIPRTVESPIYRRSLERVVRAFNSKSFFEWFMKFQDTVLSGLRRRYYTSANKVLRGSEADRKLDIFLTPADAALPDGEHDWSNVLVIGEHKQNPDEDRSAKTLVQLAGMMRLWVFDRSGPYNSEKFDIHKEPERFVKVLAGYAMMSDAELGLNTFIKRDGNGKYIVTRDLRISLEDKPIASTKAIVCRGTTCYRGRRPGSTDWEYVVKFAWPSDKRQREEELLKLAKEKGVTGIAVWFNHEQITIDGDPDTISHLRRAMKFGSPRRPSKKAFWVDSSPESSRACSKTSLKERSGSSVAHLIGLGIGAGSATTSSSGQKRKRDERLDGGSRLKRSKSDGSHASATNVHKDDQLDAIGAPSIQETVVDSLAAE